MNRNKFSGERYLSLDNSFLTDGVDDRIDFGHIPITGDFSFSVFVKRISDVPFDDFFFGQYDNNGVLRGWGLLISFNEPSFVIRDATGTVQATYGLGVIPKTDWFHFVGVFKSGQYLRTYLNGSLVYQENTAIVSPPNTSFLGGLIKTCIGRNSNNGIQANAEFVHATIFNKELTQDEIIFMHRYVGAVPQSAHDFGHNSDRENFYLASFGAWNRAITHGEIINLHNNGGWNNSWNNLPVYYDRNMKKGLQHWLQFQDGSFPTANTVENWIGGADGLVGGFLDLNEIFSNIVSKANLDQ